MRVSKTATIKGHRYTAKEIEALFDPNNLTTGGFFRFKLGLQWYRATYRNITPLDKANGCAPVCTKEEANAISITWVDHQIFLWLEEANR